MNEFAPWSSCQYHMPMLSNSNQKVNRKFLFFYDFQFRPFVSGFRVLINPLPFRKTTYAMLFEPKIVESIENYLRESNSPEWFVYGANWELPYSFLARPRTCVWVCVSAAFELFECINLTRNFTKVVTRHNRNDSSFFFSSNFLIASIDKHHDDDYLWPSYVHKKSIKNFSHENKWMVIPIECNLNKISRNISARTCDSCADLLKCQWQ